MPEKAGASTGCMTAHIALGISYDMVKALGSPDAAKQKVLEIFNYIESYFEEVDIQYKIDTFFIPQAEDDDPFSDTTDAAALLNEVTQWGENGGFGASDYDLAVIWFKRDICFFGTCNGVAGYEKMRSVCTSEKYIILEYGFNPSAEWTALSHTHEFGHAWNADHDPANIGNYIMSPQVNNTDVSWSPQSYNSIITFKGSLNCLEPCSSDTTGINRNDLPVGRVFPNPASDFLQVDLRNMPSNKSIQVDIFDTNGQIAYSSVYKGKNSYRIDIGPLSGGIYILHISDNSRSYVRKFLKN